MAAQMENRMATERVEETMNEDPVYRLGETRAALRDAAGANDRHDAFPRSEVVRLALSPRYRWITAAVATVGVVALWKRLPGRRVGLLIGAVSLARRLRDQR